MYEYLDRVWGFAFTLHLINDDISIVDKDIDTLIMYANVKSIHLVVQSRLHESCLDDDVQALRIHRAPEPSETPSFVPT
jgi:hypothetical protein